MSTAFVKSLAQCHQRSHNVRSNTHRLVWFVGVSSVSRDNNHATADPSADACGLCVAAFRDATRFNSSSVVPCIKILMYVGQATRALWGVGFLSPSTL